MSEIISTPKSVEDVTEKPKPKYYTDKHKIYMRTYRAKYGSYTETQKKAIKKYTQGLKEDAKKLRELQAKGLI